MDSVTKEQPVKKIDSFNTPNLFIYDNQKGKNIFSFWVQFSSKLLNVAERKGEKIHSIILKWLTQQFCLRSCSI